MEITLMRHGRSAFYEARPLYCKDMAWWVDEYNSQGVLVEESYPALTMEKIRTAQIVVTSDLKRSLESARLLQPEIHAQVEPLFREVELPLLNIGGLRLSPKIWLVVLRCLWLAGYSKDSESLVEARNRAEVAAQRLVGLANEYGSVVLMGHGVFNRLLGKELGRRGWQGKKNASSKHWSCTSYTFSEGEA